ncbi:MAG: adenylate/guanylate cyclase domain-containing protein [Actinomycetota bacterium]
MLACGNCGAENTDGARYCSACGRLLEEVTARREARKVVTVLFSDVTGSTRLGEQLDPESLRQIMGRYFEEMKAALEAHGGSVEKFIGDAVMAVFGIPTLHEDDALRAVRAALEMRERLERLNEDLERDRGIAILTRTGVNTGEVVAGDPATDKALVTGDAVNVAARLEQSAQPGEILIGEATFRLLRDAVTAEAIESLTVKGKSEPVTAYRLLEVHPEAEAVPRHLDSPMVGRDRPLSLMKQTFENAADDRACHLFTVIGSPGVGKSRLVHEFVSSVADRSTVLRGRCLPYGSGITYWPVVEMVRQAAAITDQDGAGSAGEKLAALVPEGEREAVTARLVEVIGLREGTAPAEEIAWGFRKLLESLAGGRQVVAVFDDIQWAEPTLLDLIDHVAEWSRDAPILLVAIARQELLDVRPGWGGGKHNATTIQLEPLSESDCEVLVENLLGMALLPEVSKSRIAEAAEGNPLFVEQVLSMLIDDELLQRDNGHWVPTADLARIPIPPTIQALLAARLDRLGGEERQVIERASVVGKVFYLSAVSELAPEPMRPAVSGHLMTLVRKELIRPDHSDIVRETAFRFRHILIRDAAYAGMPKETRAQLHEAFAGWLERVAGEHSPEFDEILGYHLEQAFRYREELGNVDERARGLAARAADHLEAAGRRALSRSDLAAGQVLLTRAAELVPARDPRHLTLLIDIGWALIELGQFARAAEIIQEVKEAAQAAGDPAWQVRADLLEAWRWDTHTSWDERGEVARRAIPFFEERGDEVGLFFAHRLLGAMHWTQGRSAESAAVLPRVIELARRTGAGHYGFFLHWLSGILMWGTTPAEEGIRRCDELLAEASGLRLAEGSILTSRAVLAAMAGRTDEARASAARARPILEDLGGVLPVGILGNRLAQMDSILGDDERALEHMRGAVDILERLGEKSFYSTLVATYGWLLARLGRLDEAEEAARKGREASPPDDWASQIVWREVMALVEAQRGNLEEGERLAREAVALTEGVDYLPQMADAWADLGFVLRLAGRKLEAAEALRESLRLREAKGDVVRAARVREELAALT